MEKEDGNSEKMNGSVEEKKDEHPEKDKKDTDDPFVVQMSPDNGSKAEPATNGTAVTPEDAEKAGEKNDEDEKEKKEEEDKDTRPPVGIFSMFRFASVWDLLLILVGTLAALAHGAALPLVIVFFGDVVDAFIMTAPPEPGATVAPTANPFQAGLTLINEFSINYVYLGCGVLVVAFFQSACWSLAAEHQVRVVRVQYFRAILSQDISWFDERKGGELTTRISDDINKIRKGTGDKLGLAIQSLSTAFAGVLVGFLRSWRLALIVVAVSMLLVIPVFAISAVLVKKYTQGALDAYAKAGAVAEEVLSAIRTVTAFGGEAKELDRYSSFLGDAKNESIKKAAAESSSLGGLFCVIYGTYAVAFWCGTIFILNSDDFSAGGILITLFCVLFGSFSLAQAGPYFADFSAARGAAAAIWEVIDQKPVIDCLSDKGAQPDELTGKITFEDVHFTYPTRKEAKILQGFNLEVNVGQKVALVGSSGCGKSTTVALIQRYYDPDSGTVKLDDQDIQGLNVKWLRENIGVVSQEPILFGTTIAENIRYGRMDVTEEEIHQAGKEANAHDFIMELPDQYNTLVGERGAQLSGGQKQRVAIARALVRNPKILLLDEATSALDSESEGIVQAALEKVQAGRTTIVIAHRLSTIKNADMICALKDGVVVEKGTHSELMDIPDGVYAKLVKQQQTKEVEEEEEAKEDLDEEDEEKEMDNKMAEQIPSICELKRGDSRHSGKKRSLKKLMTSQVSVTSETSEKEVFIQSTVKDKDSEEDVSKYFSWSRIMGMNISEVHLMIIGVIAAAFNGGIQPAFAIIFSNVLKVYGGPTSEIWEGITLYCILLAALGIIALFSNTLQGMMFSISGEKLTERLRHFMFKAMLRQEMSFFDDHDNNTGALTTRLATEASLVQGVTGVQFGLVAEVFFNIVVAIIIAFIYSWQLTLLVLAFVPLLGIAGLIDWKLFSGDDGKERKDLEQAGKVFTEATENIRTVQSLTREMTFWENYKVKLGASKTKSYLSAVLHGATFSFSQCIIYFAYSASFRFGGHLVGNGSLTFDAVFLVFSAVVFGAFGLGRAFAIAPDFSKAKTATARMFKLIDYAPPIDKYNTEGLQPEEYTPEITFDKVRFRYPTRPDVSVLSGLSVSVKPGETLALVGSSGCGKSTSVALVERFYDAIMGEVMLGAFDIKVLNLAWLRQQIGLVSQEPILFDRSIAENIAYGDNSRNVTQEEIESAAMNANIHEFVSNLPEGYETRVGDKGTQLSGGQKQRIAIARALLRNPRILLLDEATSALDTESERVVQAALDEAKKGRTCITIAHRLSTIHDAEKIAVIRHGKVAEIGTHEELMALKEQYFNLYTSQSLQT